MAELNNPISLIPDSPPYLLIWSACISMTSASVTNIISFMLFCQLAQSLSMHLIHFLKRCQKSTSPLCVFDGRNNETFSISCNFKWCLHINFQKIKYGFIYYQCSTIAV